MLSFSDWQMLINKLTEIQEDQRHTHDMLHSMQKYLKHLSDTVTDLIEAGKDDAKLQLLAQDIRVKTKALADAVSSSKSENIISAQETDHG